MDSIKKWYNKFKDRLYGVESVKIALLTFMNMLIPVGLVAILFQVFINKSNIICCLDQNIKILDSPNLKQYIFYLTSAATHILVSIYVIVFFVRKLFNNSSKKINRILVPRVLFFIIFLPAIVLFFDSRHVNLALLSHERIYFYLLKSEYFSRFFILFPGIKTYEGFYLFSIIPFTLILLGLIVIVLTCFNIGKDLNEIFDNLTDKSDKEDRIEFQKKLDDFHNYLFVLSFVLVTSIIATILFFQIPLTVIGEDKTYNEFQNISLSMGICWGVIFSLTMFAMYLYPFKAVRKKIRKILTHNIVAENSEMEKWLIGMENNYIFYKNIRTMISVFSPFFISVIAQFL